MDNFIRSRLTRALGVAAAGVLLLAPGLVAQTGSIAGRIIDAQSGQTIPAAQVFIQDLDIGVLTQQNGSYILLNVPAGPREVTVQRIGFRQIAQTVTVEAGQTAVLDFRITEEALQLDEIIITGTPGGTQRRAIGNTVSTVGVSDVTQDVAITNFQDLLSGRTPGVTFARLSGNVGTGSPIRIRGTGSFNLGANPLIYVDGVRVNNDATGGPALGGFVGGQVNVLDDFNPEDIESVEIIKGPAAASLYGTEASAGVIQIITKKGREGAPEFNVSVRQGTNYLRDPANRVLGTFWTCPTDDQPGGANPGCPSRSDLVPYNMYDEANNYIRDGYFAWPTENLYQNGLSQSYNLDVRGGTQTVRYFLSANYDNEEGFVWYNTDETFRLRANVGVVFNDHFSLDVSSQYGDGSTQFESATVSDGGLFQDLVWSNGYYLDRITPFDITAAEIAARNCGDAPTTCGGNARLGGFQEHLPSDVAQDTEATRDWARFTGSATLNITSGEFDLGGMSASLTQRIIAGVDRGWDVNRNLYRRETYVPEQELLDYCADRGPTCVPATWGNVYTETATGEMTFSKPVTSEYSFDYALTAGLQATDALRLNTAFGAQYNVREVENFSNSGQGFASTLSTTINQIAQSAISTDYELIQNKALGYYVQEEIGWNDRLFLTGALRFDDNSTFGAQSEARKYPKVSGTWLVSEESFWGFDAVNSLRLRGAWGKAGRQPNSIAQFNVYAAVPGPGGSPALRASSPGNPTIEPEVSTELELGFDLAVFDDRLSGSFTHWWREDANALLEIPLVASFGFPGEVDQNLGVIDNWGWEAQLSARLYEGDAISFDLDLGADFTDNEIKDLGTFGGGVITGSRIQIGLPWPNISTSSLIVDAGFDDPSDGLLPACTAALVASDTLCRYQLNAFGQGVWAYCDMGVDLAPAGTPTSEITKYGRLPGGEARQCTGNTGRNIFAGRGFANYTWSVAPRVSLLDNQLQVYALAEGQYGRTGADNAHNWNHIYNGTQVSRVEDDPIWVATDRANGNGCDWEKCLYDADFWKLREVGARYTLPQAWVQRTGAERASLAFSARNLWTIWQAQKEVNGAPVTDPEYGNISANGSANFWEQPALTSLNVTLRVTF
jgi:TonB-linked SusC/RagA family outer membrane protein